MASRNLNQKESLVPILAILQDYSQRGYALTPLQAAVISGNYRICKRLLREGADTSTASDYPPSLCLALDLNKFQIARLIIDSGADVLSPHHGLYPMFYAVKPETPEFIVEALIKAGFPADGKVEDKFCNTALHRAVLSKNVDVVKTLIKLHANCNVKETRFGYTPLHLAVNVKVPLIAQMLVDSGADLEAEDKAGLAPLLLAIYQNNLLFVNFLLDLGADPHHLCSGTLNYPLNIAAHMGFVAVAKALIKQGADPSRVAPGMANLPIHSAAESEHAISPDLQEKLKEIVELLIENGSEVSVPNKDGNTPVQLALKANNVKVVEVLVKEGASVNEDFGQGTTFHYVTKVANKELVRLFFEYGADYSVLDSNGNTPYHMALFNLDPNVVSIFWEFGCPFDMPKNGCTCGMFYSSEVLRKLDNQKKLMLGIKENNLNMMVNALSNGAEVRSHSVEIPFPLHYAVSNGFSSVVLLLLENGIPTNISNDKGESPLHIAASKGYFQICHYLLRYGACYNLQTKLTKKTPLDLALENNQYQIIYILREIDLMFKSSVNKSFEELHGIFGKSKNVQSLQAYINCINRAGDTLMGVAVKENNIDLVENLMKLRLQIIKA